MASTISVSIAMGIRSRLKKGLKGLLGQSQEAPRSQTSPPPAKSVPPSPVRPAPASATASPTTSPTASPAPPSAPSPAKASSSQAATPLSEDKVARHRERTRRGLLKKTLEAGGTIGLGALHDHSERRFFVGHKAFSDMMEDLVREELLLFDWDAQEATVTDAGRQYLESE